MIRKMLGLTTALVAVFLASSFAATAQDSVTEGGADYEFADVENLPPQKGLPDPFLMPDGKRVQTLQDWEKQRQYLKAMLAHYLYGRIPPRPKKIEIKQVAPNSSGTGGTGSLRYFEEGQKPQTIGHHIGKNEHWFHPRYFAFADKEERLPFDSHFARAVIAPRALVNCHARQDYWANPYGTELTHRAAAVVFKWLDAGDRIGLHWREGRHAQNEEDWAALLDFADHHFFDKSTDRQFDVWTYPDAELPFDWKAPGTLPAK